MKTVAVVALLLAALSTASGQGTSNPPQWSTEQPQVYRTTGARIAIGRNIHVPVDEEVNDVVVVIGGSARIDGRVRDGVVVIGGNLDVGAKSDVRGEIVVVGGRVHRDPGAQIRGRISDVSIGDWSSWRVGTVSLPVVDLGDLGRWLSLFATAFRVTLLALLMGLVILVARAPVARIGRSAAAEPGRAFALGLLAEIVFLPVLVIAGVSLIVTIIGIPLVLIVVPVAVVLAFIAWMLGFTALACRLGEWIEDRMGWRSNSALLATGIGLLLVAGPTMVARLVGVAVESPWGFGLLMAGIACEFIVWTIGLGATLMTGFGRWSTTPPPAPPVPQPTILPATN